MFERLDGDASMAVAAPPGRRSALALVTKLRYEAVA